MSQNGLHVSTRYQMLRVASVPQIPSRTTDWSGHVSGSKVQQRGSGVWGSSQADETRSRDELIFLGLRIISDRG